MKKIILIYLNISLLTSALCLSCLKSKSSEANAGIHTVIEKSKAYRVPKRILADHINFDKLDKVIMINNSGSFPLDAEQLEQFRKDLEKMTYEPDLYIKAGGIGFSMLIDGKSYAISSTTHGQYLEVPSSLLFGDTSRIYNAYCYRTNGVNLDNYKKR
ncbi:MAG TPA: hypothetical protein PLL53_16230 [Saprospiraceae bacterium]|nr:hypothetical protein [Saprospiraceae bacterium]